MQFDDGFRNPPLPNNRFSRAYAHIRKERRPVLDRSCAPVAAIALLAGNRHSHGSISSELKEQMPPLALPDDDFPECQACFKHG
jgi:hypothetical protein